MILLHGSHEQASLHDRQDQQMPQASYNQEVTAETHQLPQHTGSEVSTCSITVPGEERCQGSYVHSSQTTQAGKKPSLRILPLPKHVCCIYFLFHNTETHCCTCGIYILCTNTHIQKSDLPHKGRYLH